MGNWDGRSEWGLPRPQMEQELPLQPAHSHPGLLATSGDPPNLPTCPYWSNQPLLMVQPGFQPYTTAVGLDRAAPTVDPFLWGRAAVALKGHWFQKCSRVLGSLIWLKILYFWIAEMISNPSHAAVLLWWGLRGSGYLESAFWNLQRLQMQDPQVT